MDFNKLRDFYKGKKVFVTGNTGFKGTWLTKILLMCGAEVCGYALKPETEPALYDLIFDDHSASSFGDNLRQHYSDIRDYEKLSAAINDFKPELVFHLAAQPIVRVSYEKPRYTFETNVMGTVNLLEAVRNCESVKSFLNVTTDKVYKNNEWVYGYRENDSLDGYDPYSNSKSCSELVTHSYKESFFSDADGKDGRRYLAISTARAGNVIGGGDFARDRIIPDSVRAMSEAVKKGLATGIIEVRNPFSTRPYQHVLEPLAVYLTIAMKQYEDRKFAGYYNVGPDDCDCVTTGDLVDLFCKKWNSGDLSGLPKALWESHAEAGAVHEANFLKLDTSLIKATFDWKPRWHIDECMDMTVRFSKILLRGGEIGAEMEKEIGEFLVSE